MSASFLAQHKWPRVSESLEKLFNDKGIDQTTSIRIFGLTDKDVDSKSKQSAIKESIGKYFDSCGKISRIDIVKKNKKYEMYLYFAIWNDTPQVVHFHLNSHNSFPFCINLSSGSLQLNFTKNTVRPQPELKGLYLERCDEICLLKSRITHFENMITQYQDTSEKLREKNSNLNESLNKFFNTRHNQNDNKI